MLEMEHVEENVNVREVLVNKLNNVNKVKKDKFSGLYTLLLSTGWQRH
jgi:hypothetical protein